MSEKTLMSCLKNGKWIILKYSELKFDQQEMMRQSNNLYLE